MTDQLGQQNQVPPMQVDAAGNVFVDGCKIARLEGQTLLFFDRDKRRASARGSDQVRVPIAALIQLQKKP